jgi:hypothetical protein
LDRGRGGRFHEDESGLAGIDFRDLPSRGIPVFDEDSEELELRKRGKDSYSLSSIPEPDLLSEEERLPEVQRNLRILLKKCQMVGCYNFLKLNQLLEYLKAQTSPGPNVEDNAVFLNGFGPHKFYVSWFSDTDKSFLLSKWLSAEIAGGEIPSLTAENITGNLVITNY